jgi:hypothetical protein
VGLERPGRSHGSIGGTELFVPRRPEHAAFGSTGKFR